MKISIAKFLIAPVIALLLMAAPAAPSLASAAATSAPVPVKAQPASAAPASAAPASAAATTDDTDDVSDHKGRLHKLIKIQVNEIGNSDNSLVAVGHDVTLDAGKDVDAVVAIFGSATSSGNVSQAVVSVFGDNRVMGPVGQESVAVFGNNYVDSKVGDSVAAIFGNVELGPHADVGGDLVVIGGTLTKDPGAQLHGDITSIQLPIDFSGGGWMRRWIANCLMYGRPLAFVSGLGWAWSLAIGFLVLYLLLALLFHRGVDRVEQTLEHKPGTVTLTALFSILLWPVLFVLLCITVIGIPLIPFAWFAWWLAGLFGKCVMLAWIGRRLIQVLGRREPVPAVVGVLLGGVIVLLLYTVPVVGFITFKLLGLLGRAAVLVALVEIFRARPGAPARQSVPPVPPVAPAAAMDGTAAAAESVAPPEAAAAAPAASVPASAAVSYPRAGFWIRMGALLVDAIIIGIVLSPFHHENPHDLMLIALAIYGAVMWKLKGTTIGGLLFHLQVVRLDGRPVDWGTSIVRALSCFLAHRARLRVHLDCHRS